MVRTFVPFDITICGIPEIEKCCEAGVSHVLSIIDPAEPEPAALRRIDAERRLLLRFDDVVAEYPGFDAPQRHHVERLLEFGETLKGREDVAHVLIHCHAGISRSTAAAATLMAQHNAGREKEAFLALLDMRPHAWPNTRMVTFADELLGRGGAMLDALVAYRRALLDRKPQLAEVIRNIGRGNELPA